MAVTLTQLTSYLTVVRRGSVTAAAKELVVTQPLGVLETISLRGGLPERRWHVVRSAVGPVREEVAAFMAFCRSPVAKHALAKPLR